jgi:Ca-activated chloride channel family protein
VSEYRLIGYENRVLAREDFNNDKVDAGDIGAGHTVTALYEIRFSDSENLSVDKLRYDQSLVAKDDGFNPGIESELGFLKLRYKKPGQTKSQLIKQALLKKQLLKQSRKPTQAIRFASAVAGFAMQLKGGKYLNDFGYQQIADLAQNAKGEDKHGIRGEFLQLVSLANLLSQKTAAAMESPPINSQEAL